MLSPHLDHALDLEGDERARWLAALRAEDAALADELEALLARDAQLDAQGFLAAGPPLSQGEASLAGHVLGSYTLRSPIGQGGMGSVWLAERSDGRFEGLAAVKLLNVSLVGRMGEARFQREGSILARLQHPHIAHLIDAGVSPQGQPYLVLERVDGERIDSYCDARDLGVEVRVRLFLDVLAAVAHAHASLVVHRDLKPSNVLVDARGKVKLLDFGIAKLLEGDTGEVTALTRDGESVLTPEYAAPEQLTGGDITTATDVYALGVLLYLLLTGRHPAAEDAGSPAQLVKAIVDTEPARASDAVTAGPLSQERAAKRAATPRRLRGELRGDLDNIVAKALKKRPAERYASAEAMADDLRRYLERQPVRARPDSLAYRARKFAARNRLTLGAAAVAAFALLAGTAAALWQARASARQRDRALVQLRRAEATNDFTTFLLSVATPGAGRPISNAEMLARGEALVERRFAKDGDMRAHLLLTLASRYHDQDQFDRWQATADRAFQASRGSADVGLRARAACVKADALADQEHWAEADALLSSAFKDLAALSDATWDEAECRALDSSVAAKRGDGTRAAASAERAVALEESLKGPAGPGPGALHSLAVAYLVAERTAAADRAFRRLVSVLEREGLEKTEDITTTLNNWSVMLQNAGQYLEAVPLSERAVRIERERDTEHGPSLTMLRTYGAALCTVGRCAEGLPLLEEALAKARTAGSPRRLIDVLQAKANVHCTMGAPERAAPLLREAEALLAAQPSPPPPLLATMDRSFARLALARGDAPTAVERAQRAAAHEDDATRGRYMTMLTMLLLAETRNANHDFSGARAPAEHALRLATESLSDLTHSFGVGRAHVELGVALAGLGDAQAGRRELELALEHLRPSVGEAAPVTRRALARLAEMNR